MNKKLSEFIKTIPKFSQRQDSVTSQLSDIREVANKLGMYDVADIISNLDNNLTKQKYACHVDLFDNEDPDECVIDANKIHKCCYAIPGMKKEKCQYWRIVR